MLAKIQEVCKVEGVEYSDDGLEAIVFTAQGFISDFSIYIQKDGKRNFKIGHAHLQRYL